MTALEHLTPSLSEYNKHILLHYCRFCIKLIMNIRYHDDFTYYSLCFKIYWNWLCLNFFYGSFSKNKCRNCFRWTMIIFCNLIAHDINTFFKIMLIILLSIIQISKLRCNSQTKNVWIYILLWLLFSTMFVDTFDMLNTSALSTEIY